MADLVNVGKPKSMHVSHQTFGRALVSTDVTYVKEPKGVLPQIKKAEVPSWLPARRGYAS